VPPASKVAPAPPPTANAFLRKLRRSESSSWRAVSASEPLYFIYRYFQPFRVPRRTDAASAGANGKNHLHLGEPLCYVM
jgi:hypothetical protein